jgi:translation initiation factor IF-3
MSEPFVVKFVNFSHTKLLDQNNVFHDDVRIGDAKTMALNAGLDLVCFNLPQNGTPAFCKLVNYGKWKYQNEKQKRKIEKGHKKEHKEMRFTPNIGDHDIAHKTRQINGFLDEGDDVLVVMKLKGRECLHMAEAEIKTNQIIALCTSGKEMSRKKTSNIIFIRLVKNNGVVEENKTVIETKPVVNVEIGPTVLSSEVSN